MDPHERAIWSLVRSIPSTATTHADVKSALPAVLQARPDLARLMGDRSMYRIATLVQAFRRFEARQARLDSAPRAEAKPAPGGVVPRITCPRCNVSVAELPPDYRGRPRIRPHNCAHGWNCIAPPVEPDYSSLTPEQAAEQRRKDEINRRNHEEWLRRRYPRRAAKGLSLGPCPECAAARAAELATPATLGRRSPGEVAIVMSSRAAAALPGLRLGAVRPAGGDLVAVHVPAVAASACVTGQLLVKVDRRRRRAAQAA